MTTSVAARDIGPIQGRTKKAGCATGVSSWRRRAPIVILAGIGAGIAAYLGAYQIGIVQHVWDPVFGRGSETVLRSSISRALPMPDAILGAVGYAVEAISALIGGTSRWRTNSLFVCACGVLVFGLATGAVLLTMVQLFLIHQGCTLCLCSAALSLTIAALAYEEFVAAVQNFFSNK